MLQKSRRTLGLLAAFAALLILLGCVFSASSTEKGILATAMPKSTGPVTPRIAEASVADSTSQLLVVTATPEPVLSRERFNAVEAMNIEIYERVSPSVVHITSRVIMVDFFGGLTPSEGTGSGFVIDKKGDIVTNNHVIERAETIEVTLFDGTVAEADVVGVDPLNDLAVIRIDVGSEKLHPVTMAQGELKVGQQALAIGNPFGLDWTLTVGVISSLGRPLRISSERIIYDVIQTDAAINPGNSGGPLLDSKGNLIGVNSAIRQGADNIAFAIPLSTLKRIVPELVENGRYRHPWLGIMGYTLFPELSRRLNLPAEEGILVARVGEDSPAKRAGLHGATRQVELGNARILVGGDIVVEIDGVTIDSNDALYEFLETKTRFGQKVEVSFYRGDKLMSVPVVLGERPF